MARVPESDMVMLTLSLIGGLAVAPYLARRGSAKKDDLAPLQKRLLYLSKMLPGDPEAVIRTQDLVMAALDGTRSTSSLPGLTNPRSELESDIRDPNLRIRQSSSVLGTDAATLHDYVAFTDAQIAQNKHFSQLGYEGEVQFSLARRSKYDKLVPWLGMVVRQLLEQARRGELTTRRGMKPRGYWRGEEPSEQEVEVFRRLGVMRNQLSSVADWVQATNPLLTGGRDAQGRKVKSLTWNQAQHRSARWHAAMEAQELSSVTPGRVVYTGPDGWTVQRLEKRVCLLEEGKALAHCVKGEGYWREVEQRAIEIYSLRGPNGAPVVTFEVTPQELYVDDLGVVEPYSQGLGLYDDDLLAVEPEETGEPARVVQAKGKKNRVLGTKKAQMVIECLHTRAWMEQMLGRPVRPGDITGDLVPCQQILLRITGWDRIDTVATGQTPDPMPSQAEYNKAMKELAQLRRQSGGRNRGRRLMGARSVQRPPPIFGVVRARKAARLIGRVLARVLHAAQADREIPLEQRERLARLVHQALLILDGYLIGRPASTAHSRQMEQAARRVVVDYDTDGVVYLSDDGYSRLVLNLIRMDDTHPWVFVASESLPETKARWATLTGQEA